MEQEIEYGLKERVLHYYFLNRNQVHGWTVGIVVGCALVISYLAAGPSEGDLTLAKEAFAKWKEAPAETKLAADMLRLIKKVPGLERGLEAEIAQTYMAQGMSSEGEKFAQASLSRLEKVSPLHAQFGEVSLMIERGDYQGALEQSVRLKGEMEQTLDSKLWKGSRMGGGSALYVCNLLRIACLQKQLKNPPGELAAWEEIKGLMEPQGEVSAAVQFLQANFRSQQFSLADYISQRERSLTN